MSLSHRLILSATLLVSSASAARAEIAGDFEMDRDPEVDVPAAVKVFANRLKPLWLEALASPEADMQRMAADAIGRGHIAGVPGMGEAIPGLVAVLTSPSSRSAARLAAARALVKLEAKEAAPRMAEAARQYGADLRQIVEPALADWNYEPQLGIWLARLKMPDTRRRDLVLAIRGLAAAKNDSGITALLGIVHDGLRPPDVRFEAARAAGLIQDRGLESDARRLIAGSSAPPMVDRLCAVRLIARHGGDDAQLLLLQFAVDTEPAVAVIALTRLIEIDPHHVLPLAELAMQSADARVRQCGADACVLLPDVKRVETVARLLDDPHPDVRRSVRRSLFTLAKNQEFDGTIRGAAMQILAADNWRGLEQAALLLGKLDHKPAAARLIELLEFARPETGVAAAWGLKKLAVPSTLPALLEKARRNTEIRKRRDSQTPALDDQTAHLFEAFGRMKYAPAEALLAEYIPKDYKMGVQSRSAAIWSLGLLHAGVPDEALAEQLIVRATDFDGPPSEMISVQMMSVVSIGRMQSMAQVEALKKLATIRNHPLRFGILTRWSLKELTDEHIPELDPRLASPMGWFLEPLND